MKRILSETVRNRRALSGYSETIRKAARAGSGTRRHVGHGVPKRAVPGIAFNGNSIEFGAACRASCVRLDAPAICRRNYMNDQTIRASRFCVASAGAARERCRCFPSPHTLMFFKIYCSAPPSPLILTHKKSDIDRHDMLRSNEQRRHRAFANAQIVAQRYAATIRPGHWDSRADTLNLADRLTHRAKHIVILVRDVPAVERERCSLGLDRSGHRRVISVENQVSSHDR